MDPEDEIFVQIKFTKPTEGYGVFRDAIIMPLEEYNTTTPAAIQELKQERVDAWIAVIEEGSNKGPEEELVPDGKPNP